MKSIRIISPNFNLLGEVDSYSSLIFPRSFFDIQNFEIHMDMDLSKIDILKEGNFVLIDKECNKVGIIEHVEKHSRDGKETITVTGNTLKGILRRRLIIPPTGSAYDRQEGSQEFIMKQFVKNNVINTEDENRRIENFYIADNQDRGKPDKWRGRYEVLSDKLGEIAHYSELGWDIFMDIENSRLIFDVIEGRDLTVDQNALPPVIFSVDFDNVGDRSLIESALHYKNVGYAAGNGEEEDRFIQQIGKGEGLSRREVFLDCGNIDKVEELKTAGKQKLKEFAETFSFEINVIPNNSFKYEIDYNLGDKVSLIDKSWGIKVNARIIEITEVYEDEFSLEHIFGMKVTTILDDIKSIKSNKVIK